MADDPQDRILAATNLADGASISWTLPAEVPIGLVYDDEPHAVMMATPCDLVDFAHGYSLAEGVVHAADEILQVREVRVGDGVELRLRIADKRLEKLRMHASRRAHRGRAGCGICGVDKLSDALRPLPKLRAAQPLQADVVLQAMDALPDHQVMRRSNRTVHGAAWVGRDGEIHLVREDIGRHNALDKLIGALMQQSGTDEADGFVLLSSRCTYELVQKCALAGINALVCLAAPTSRAVEVAQATNVQLTVIDRQTRRALRFA